MDLLRSENISDIIDRIKPTHLIHLAWYTEHGKYWNSPLNVEWTRATYYLLDAFYKRGGEHALITGTCAEYDWRYGYCMEDMTPLKPTTLYGEAKNATRCFSELIKNQYEKPLAWARIFFPYGSDESYGRLIPSLFRFFRGKEFPFGVNRYAYRDFLHVSDVVGAIMLCVEKKFDGILNICSGKPTSIEQIVREIANICGGNPDQVLEKASNREEDPTFLVGDNQKLRALGWVQKVDIRQGLLTY